MHLALETLLAGAIDYAGLFPPAALDMAAAVREYATYRGDAERRLLGRFVVPVLRLPELESVAAPQLPRSGGAPWRLSVLVGADPIADIRLALAFNARHDAASDEGHAVIDTLELRADTAAGIEGVMSRVPDSLATYFELPLATDPAPLVASLARTGARAKARTGGVVTDAFPAPDQVVRFLTRCRDAGVACKFTAGLHHPMRGTYRLTYAHDAPIGTMYGYLNVFVAAVLACAGAAEPLVQCALLEEDATALAFDDAGLRYRGFAVPTAAIRAARERFVHSFGSCSFHEPADELAQLPLS